MTEAELQVSILTSAQTLGIYAYHTHDSRRATGKGFPDLVLIGHHGILFRELKSEEGGLRSEQRYVGYRLEALGQDWAIWRPSDWQAGKITKELRSIA